MICSSRELSVADVKLMQAYKAALNNSQDKILFKKMQNSWRSTQRDACSDADCMLKAYNGRIAELSQ